MAALNGGFKNVGQLADEPKAVSAVLVQIGHKNKDHEAEAIVTSQTSLKIDSKKVVSAIDSFMTEIEKVTEGMLLVDAQATANTGLHCYERNSYGSCSLHLIDQVSYAE